ncbi:MAG: YafY family transcriptional regulator [Hydrogenophilales bacterium]|nr:YafY family transcriptional regulator [Hydrogenophilales bacterium]
MRRADRLFQIVLLLGRGRVVTARQMATELEVSERTVYRDITDLMAAGTPIDGEAGVGYRLRPGYQVPPLMFDGEELEALALGASMVRAWADAELARAAERVLAKVDAVLPDRLRGRWDKETLLAPDFFIPPQTVTGMPQLRKAIDERLMVHMAYAREDGTPSERVVWPLGLVFWGTKWTLAAWCELRGDFRTFRLDRIDVLELLPSQFPDMAGRRFKDYIARARGGEH